MPNFEDVELGDEIGPMETEATDEGVEAFCRLWENPKPNRSANSGPWVSERSCRVALRL